MCCLRVGGCCQVMLLIVASLVVPVRAGEVSQSTDPSTGWQVYTLREGKTVAKVIPAAGCNVFSLQVDGIQYLRVPPDLTRAAGVSYGTPILYPTPNRVRGGQFAFQGQTIRLNPKPGGGNFIHGLVHSAAWSKVRTESDSESASLVAELPFAPGHADYQRFPFPHTLRLKVTVTAARVRWDYAVDNSAGSKPVPFGFALHPYLPYLGERDQTFLQVPATHWMEAVELLPTGRLVPLDQTQFDLRQPTPLNGLRLDDVYLGMTPERPVVVDFRDRGLRMTFRSSSDFTHMVVYTPDRDFFCLENQTCSTDAHNLAAQGKLESAHLQICEPGQMMSGWVELTVSRNAAQPEDAG